VIFIRSFAMLIFCVLCQWWAGEHLSVFGAVPGVALLFTVALSGFVPAGLCHLFGFLCGLYLDFASLHQFGSNALLLTTAAHFVWLLRRRLDMTAPFTQAVLCLGISFGQLILYYFLGLFVRESHSFPTLWRLLAEPVMNGLLAPFVFAFIGRFGLVERQQGFSASE